MRLRSLAGAVLVAALIGPAPAADATCVAVPDLVVCVPAGPGSVYVDGGGDISEWCVYVKMNSPAPPGWPPGNNSGGPYVFIQTKAWGNQYGYGYGWDYRFCDLLLMPVVAVDIGEDRVSVDVQVAEQSIHVDVPLPVPPPAGSVPVPVPPPAGSVPVPVPLPPLPQT